ncbi:MAG: hypothetical protein IPL91_02960 [Hyphomicrobium sp.]|nr:hypothetical protein [Hyphomicrobium sp.]
MSKFALIAAAAAAVLAMPFISSVAEAGGCGGYGGGSYYGARSTNQSYSPTRYSAPTRRVAKQKPRIVVAKKAATAPVRTAAYQLKTVVSDAAPAVYVPAASPVTKTAAVSEAPASAAGCQNRCCST